jgi:hypothetical protein
MRGVTVRRPVVLFLAAGLCVLSYLSLTVHRRAPSEFGSDPGARRTQMELSQWQQHGYFASYGLLRPSTDPHTLYRSSSGAHRLTAYVVWQVTGGSPYAQAAHNQLVSLAASVLLALVAYRLALRLEVSPLQARALGIGAGMVLLTFPDNLALFWDMSAQAYWLVPALAFFLFEKRWQRLLLVFAMTWLEYVAATMFVGAWVLASFVLGDERPRYLKSIGLAWLAALALFGLQIGLAGIDSDSHLTGSGFAYRTGLDGDAELYGTPLDIAFGRDIVRAQRPAVREQLFRWPLLFCAGLAACLAMFLAYARGRAPRETILPLLALSGAYVLYAGVFSQAVALHPYLYDAMLVTPLILALFGLLPALVENRSGVVTVVAFLAAAWTAFYQVRVYAMTYPLR